MNYNLYTKEALIKRIEQLERLNSELLRENDSTLTFAWSGNLGQWYLDFESGEVVFNMIKAQALGYAIEEIPTPTPYTFFTTLLHPDDYFPVMKNMKDHMDNLSDVYEVEYRIKAKDGSYKWFYDRGKVTQRDSNQKALLAAGIVFDITSKKLNELKIFIQQLSKELNIIPKLGRGKRLSLNLKSPNNTYNFASIQENGEVWFYGIVYNTNEIGNKQIGIDYLKNLAFSLNADFDDKYKSEWSWCVKKNGKYVNIIEYLNKKEEWKKNISDTLQKINKIEE